MRLNRMVVVGPWQADDVQARMGARTRAAAAWHDWQTLGGAFKGAPAAVSWGPHRIDLFVQGTDDHLGHFWCSR